MPDLKEIIENLNKSANPEKAKILSRFFKTGKGEYGEGDVFLGIVVPNIRKVAYKFIDADSSDIQKLLKSKIHEYRLTALEILVAQYERTEDKEDKRKIFEFYLKNTRYINNWDLVDLSASYIVGDYLIDKDRSILYKLCKSESIWERRISIISTHRFIKNKEYKDTFKICEILIEDKHPLIHKATGWMLMEVGKNIGKEIEKKFLNKNYKVMPRIMLSYAIEHFLIVDKKHYKNNKK